jgi:hypothetical protein
MPELVRAEVEEHGEFVQADRQRRGLDHAAWAAAMAHRLAMPPLTAAAFDPGSGALDGGGLAFVADDDAATVRTRATTIGGVDGFVRGAVVAAEAGFTPGTLVLGVEREDVDDVDPRTLRLLRFDEQADSYTLVEPFGFDVENGYVWGRITAPGIYAVFGLPSPGAVKGNLLKGPGAKILTDLLTLPADWESLDPANLSGCIYDLALAGQTPGRLYAAASDGGVWRLDSVADYPGRTWVPLTDRQPSLVVNCVAVAPSDDDVVYYVDGPGQLYRSNDRGDTWVAAGSAPLQGARRMLVHPSDSGLLYVATWTGLWRSLDGGLTWDSAPGQTTLRDGDMLDVALDPGDPSIVFLAQRLTGVLRSGDGGTTWAVTLPWSAANGPGDRGRPPPGRWRPSSTKRCGSTPRAAPRTRRLAEAQRGRRAASWAATATGTGAT